MTGTPLEDLRRYLDEFLSIQEIPDYPGAWNGLQVEGPRQVRRIAAAVDGCEATIREAAAAECDLLLVHHGLLWGAPQRFVGPAYRRLEALVRAGIAVYAAHLPLDVHPEIGNNAELARMIGVEGNEGFAEYQGRTIGRAGNWRGSRTELVARLAEALGCEPRVLPFGPEAIERVGVLTGSGGSSVREAAERGLDALITGEASHPAYFDAEEHHVNVILAGHYATETLGVCALARHLADRFGVAWVFVDHPTGF